MTIKGTLETFNLRELLQMLAFNQKVGTLVLESERGPRTVYVDSGRAAFIESDLLISQALLRLLRRRRAVDTDRLERAYEICERSNRFLGDILSEMGLLDDDQRAAFYEEAVCERLFNAQLTAINRFEFIDGEALDPDGRAGNPIEPTLPVEGLLLELTRKVDQWEAIAQVIPTVQEIFEGTSVAVDLAEDEAIDLESAELVVPAIDGYRTIERIAEVTDVDLFTVVQVAAALFQGGGIRAVPTGDLLVRAEDLFTRSEPAAALPLLRRGVERGDAPPEVRLRVADALELCAQPLEAAAELDTYAALSDGAHPPSVFQALHRALVLRGGDMPTSARLCDFYLRNRAWLAEYRREACDALQTLVQHAQADGRPQDAAPRLAGFIEAGDVPSEELLTLAELYKAEGNNGEAAGALYRRAEDMLASERVAPARELLRRALGHDPSRVDIRRRLMDLDGQARRRKQRRRILLVVVLFGLIAVGAAGAWWSYNREAGAAVKKAQKLAETAVGAAEREADQLFTDFEALVARIETARDVDVDLGDEVAALRKSVRAAMEGPQPRLGAYASELESYQASGHEDTHRTILRGLEHRMKNPISRVSELVDRLAHNARTSLDEGEAAYKAGEINVAAEDLLRARNLAFDDATIRERARLLLKYVDDYAMAFEAHRSKLQAGRDAGDIPGTYRAGIDALVKMLDSDLTRSLRFPVEVRSTPPGAEVFVGGVAVEQRTPCVIEYSPFDENTTLHVRLPGRTAASRELPTYVQLTEKPEQWRSWAPRFEAKLPVGARYAVSPKDGGFGHLWRATNIPAVMTSDGLHIHGVDPVAGRLQPGMKVVGTNRMRMGGVFEDGAEWRVKGQRTVWVHTPRTGEPWEVQAEGRVERAPAVVGDTLTFVDELGILYGFDLATGMERWRRNIGAAPSQPPYASPLGILIATSAGAGLKVDPMTGSVKSLGPASRGNALVLPLGERALFLGGGTDGCRLVDAKGAITVVGDARPALNRVAAVSGQGVAWVDQDGVRWIGNAADARPVALTGLGRGAVHITSAPDHVYAVDATGTMSGAHLAHPASALFRVPLGGAPGSAPLAIDDAVFVLIGGRLVAVER